MAWAFSNQGGLTSEEHERVRRLSKDYSDMRIPWEPVTGR
jgi:3-methyladenine DNA glycosylase AlkC